MDYRTVDLLMRRLSAKKGDKFSLMDTYEHLWTPRERMKIRNDIAREKMERSDAQRKIEEDYRRRFGRSD